MKQIYAVLFVCMATYVALLLLKRCFEQRRLRQALILRLILQARLIITKVIHLINVLLLRVKRGLDFTGMKARQVELNDFSHFDLILAADKQNLHDLQRICPAQFQSKLALILDFCEFEAGIENYVEVPDPYMVREMDLSWY